MTLNETEGEEMGKLWVLWALGDGDYWTVVASGPPPWSLLVYALTRGCCPSAGATASGTDPAVAFLPPPFRHRNGTLSLELRRREACSGAGLARRTPHPSVSPAPHPARLSPKPALPLSLRARTRVRADACVPRHTSHRCGTPTYTRKGGLGRDRRCSVGLQSGCNHTHALARPHPRTHLRCCGGKRSKRHPRGRLTPNGAAGHRVYLSRTHQSSGEVTGSRAPALRD